MMFVKRISKNLYSIINKFYIGEVFFKIATEIKNGNINFDKSIFPMQPHVTRVFEIAHHPELSDAFHNNQNRKLFIDTFTNFETTISLCFEKNITDIQLDTLVKDLNSKIIRLTAELGLEQQEQLFNELKKNTFIPLTRKFRHLVRLNSASYPSNFKEDLAFLEFCSKLRNCVSHSAAYYKGKDYQYRFEGINFIFKNEEFLEMIGTNNDIFLQINEKLTKIFYDLTKCMTHIGFIQYPDDGY